MKTLLDINQWPRKDHFHFFSKFDEPFFGATMTIDCSKAYDAAKNIGVPFFVYYLHKVLVVVNSIEPFRYRISGDEIEIWNKIDASPTISREDGSFAFALFEFDHDITKFAAMAKTEVERVRNTQGLFTRSFDNQNIIHFSALPWIDFTSLSHARSFSIADSCPKISVGKISETDGKKTFPVSVHVHHGLMDGFHVGQFIDKLQWEMDLI